MKRLFPLLFTLLALLLAGCRSGDRPEYEGAPETHLTYRDGSSSMTIKDAPEGTLLTLRLRTTAKSDKATTYALELTGLEGATLTPSEITLPAGSVSCDAEVTVKTSGLVFSETTATITLKGTREAVSLIVKPRTTLTLTPHEQSLLTAWRRDLGIDLVPFLGEMVCDGTVEEPGGEDTSPRFIEPRTVHIDHQVMTVAISPHATEERPVLDFTENALGLEEYFKEVFLHKTILDTEYWNIDEMVLPKLIRERLGWTEKTPVTLTLSLVNVTVDPQDKTRLDYWGSVKEAISKVYRPTLPDNELTKRIYEDYPVQREENGEIALDLFDDDKVFNLFHFDLSIWNDLVKLAKTSPEINEACYSTLISPYQIFFCSGVDEDEWKDDATVTHYVKPSGTIDYDKQTMHFVTVMDIDGAASYSVIDITCRPKH